MVKVSYSRKDTVMTIRGHANFGKKGEDLVCSGASTLAFTLVACVDDDKEKFMPNISQKDGELRIECTPGESYVTPCRRMMDTIFTGYQVLENAYPDYVRTEKED